MNDELIEKNKRLEIQIRNNLIGQCIIWSMSVFGTYLIMFYSKYFPGNIYVNYSIPAIADVIYTLYIKVLTDKFIRSGRVIKALF